MAVIAIKPTLKQHLGYQLLDNAVTRFFLFGGGAGGGKSWLGCEWLLRNCYLYPGSKWYIGRKELKRLMSSTYVTWLKVCKHHNIPTDAWKLNGQYNYIEFVKGKALGSRIDLLDVKEVPSDPQYERFGSLEYTGGWLEEAGEIPFLAFDVLKSRVGRHLNREYNLVPKTLLTCNPTQNWLFRVFYKPWRDRALSNDYAFVRSLHGDNPHQPDTYEAQLASMDDAVLRARLKDGIWEYDQDAMALIDYESILDLFKQEVDESMIGYLTADIARYGSDKVTIGVWRGFNLYQLKETAKQSLVNTEATIKQLLFDERIPYRRAVIDEDGVGGGVVDHLSGVQGFMGNRASVLRPEDAVEVEYLNVPPVYLRKQNYRNLRAQCHFLLAQKINNHEIAITAKLTGEQKEQIIEELRQVRRVDTGADAPLQIVPKDEVKEAIGRSPDYSDMLMMRMYFELLKEAPQELYRPIDEDKIAGSGATSKFGGVGFDY